MISVLTQDVGFSRKNRKEAIETFLGLFDGNIDAASKSIKEDEVSFEEAVDITGEIREEIKLLNTII